MSAGKSEPRVIAPDLKLWPFARREAELFKSAASDLPTWRVANQARKYLAGVIAELADDLEPSASPLPIQGLDAELARRVACVNLGGIIVRGTGSIMSQIGCGHEREALGTGRTTLEALIRGRQTADDPSGDVARTLLKGHTPGSLKKAAQRYGDKGDVEFLDRFAHADLIGLLVVMTPRPGRGEADLELMPQRGGVGPSNQLLNAAHTAAMFSVVMAEVFGVGVQIPPYLAGQLLHYNENPLAKGK